MEVKQKDWSKMGSVDCRKTMDLEVINQHSVHIYISFL